MSDAPDGLLDAWNACGYYRLVGMTVTEAGDGGSALRMRVGAEHLQAYGTAHGGVTAGLLDAAMGLAVLGLAHPPQVCTTVEMKVNFIAGVRPGVVTASGRVLHLGRRIVTATAEAHDATGALVAAAQGTFALFTPRGDT